MSLVKKQPVIVAREIRIESSVGELLDDYARFIDSTPDHVVNSVLKKALEGSRTIASGARSAARHLLS